MAIVYDPNSGQYIDDQAQADPSTLGTGLGTYTGEEGLRRIQDAYASVGITPTADQLLAWGPNPSKSDVDQALSEISLLPGAKPKSGTTSTTTTTTPGSTTGGGTSTSTAGGDPAAFGNAWLASGGRTVQDLASFVQQWNTAHPGFPASITGSKQGNVSFGTGGSFDALYAAGSGGSYATWNPIGNGSTGTDAGGAGSFAIDPQYLDPFTTPFQPGADTQLPPAPQVSPFSYPDFQVPDPSKVALDPYYQFRLNQGLDAIKANKAAQGTLNTGGTLKDYMSYGQGLASQEGANIFDRDFRTWGANRDNAFGSWLANASQGNTTFNNQKGLADDAYGRAWAQYLGLENTFRQNQNGPFQKLFSLANIGNSAASV